MNRRLNYILSCSGKNHYIDIAKVLHQRNQLKNIVCGYPWYKLKNYQINKKFVSPNGLIRILREPLIGSSYFQRIDEFLNKLNSKMIDRVTCDKIDEIDDVDVLLGFAGVSKLSGKKINEKKKIYLCDSTSAHIKEQNTILADEYKEFLNKKVQINSWVIDYKTAEYENANIILTPSRFVKKSFEKFKFSKMKVLELATNTTNFFPIEKIKKSDKFFDILFVGQQSLQKGLHYLIEGFKKFNHPNKRLHIIGSQTKDKKFFSNKLKHKDIIVYGQMKQFKINDIANKCHVCVLPSIQDGFGLVVLQAAAAGCPSIVSENTGALDFIEKYECGLSVPIRDSNSIADKLQLLSDDKDLLKKFTLNAIKFSKNNTWENYVERLEKLILDYKNC